MTPTEFTNGARIVIDVSCFCARPLELHADRDGRLVALVRHNATCDLGALVAGQPSILPATRGAA